MFLYFRWKLSYCIGELFCKIGIGNILCHYFVVDISGMSKRTDTKEDTPFRELWYMNTFFFLLLTFR
jgi:hypothetical protein